MTSNWLKNMCGMTLDDEAMQNIPHPFAELTLHVSIKGVQFFGIIGTFVVGPLAAVARKQTRNWPGVKNSMTRMGRGGAVLGVLSGPVLTYMKIRKEEDPYKVWDRCYRLRHSRSQVLVDQSSIVGAAGGAAVSAMAGSGAMFGGLIGMTAGVLGAAVYNNAVKKEK